MSFCKIIGFTKRIYHFIKSSVLLREFISFCKIIGFTKQIYEDKSLSQNHVFIFSFSDVTPFICLLTILWFPAKLMDFKHNRIFWAHMGPNPDRALTRTGPQPGPGPAGWCESCRHPRR